MNMMMCDARRRRRYRNTNENGRWAYPERLSIGCRPALSGYGASDRMRDRSLRFPPRDSLFTLIVQSRERREADLPKCHQQDRSVKEVRPIVELRKCGNVPFRWRPAAPESGGSLMK